MINLLFKLVFIWIIPIGFVDIILNKYGDNWRWEIDGIGKHTFWRIRNVGKPFRGAGILIRRKSEDI